MSGSIGFPVTTPLARRIVERIAREGPLSIDRFMAACLLDPEHGYYMRREPIGAGGDFVTAPEISQVFGELIGLWAVVVWQQMGSPRPIRLIEIGPGRGTLMADALRALRKVPEMRAALDVQLIEASPTLEAVQQRTLTNVEVPVSWSADGSALEGPAIVIANEFLDALPVRQLVRAAPGWSERAVGLDRDGNLTFVEGNPIPAPQGLANAEPGAIIELRDWNDGTSPFLLLSSLARSGPLAALFVDYGHEGAGPGETLQAVRRHAYESPLANPGKADLSAHVEFAAFRQAAERAGLATLGSITQAELLASLGIAERARRLMQSASPQEANLIEHGIARLMDPHGMGSRFRAVALTSPGLPAPPGFERAQTRA